ncbi:hypothetical protein [Mangrovimonas xylaniphaga]|uniref:hypothetical protein n=1 Tax=Mangrovimonas xylaniphaga TaxID=1645915 RepID=UPI0006B610C3|nr:hypothetical protein [Mangrovimonas xylaniphaga]
MTKRKVLAYILTIVLALGLAVFIYYLISLKRFYDVRESLNKNSFDFVISDDLQKDKIDVYWSTDYKHLKKIISSGKQTGLKYKEYGKNTFIVTYDQDTVGRFGYFKFNNWHSHQHIVKLTKTDHSIIDFKVEIYGPDAKNKIK